MNSRPDNVRNFNAKLLRYVFFRDVEIEPGLRNVNGSFARSVNTCDKIRARGFWRPNQNAFFDIRIK